MQFFSVALKDDGASKLIREIETKYAKKMVDTEDLKVAKVVGIVYFFFAFLQGNYNI